MIRRSLIATALAAILALSAACSPEKPATDTEKAKSPAAGKSHSSNKVLTVKNSPDLRNLLVKGENDAVSKAFAKKYAGRTIEFDGSIATASGGLYLIYAGDDSDTESVPGPSFQMRNVEVGGQRPSAGANLHFIAKVGKFNAVQSLFLLDPVSTTRR